MAGRRGEGGYGLAGGMYVCILCGAVKLDEL